MDTRFLCLVFLLCVASASAFWRLDQVPDFVKSVVRSEEPKDILHKLWNSNEAQLVKGTITKGEARFLENILRFGTLRQPPSSANDEGHATNCGPASHNFSLTWVPKSPDTSGSLQFSFNMIAPAPLNGGTADIIAYMYGTPLVEQKLDLCKSVPTVGLKCPITKGQKISASYTVSDLSMLPSTTYTIIAKITDKKSRLYLCANATITVRG